MTSPRPCLDAGPLHIYTACEQFIETNHNYTNSHVSTYAECSGHDGQHRY